MRYPILNLWTWDGAKEHLRKANKHCVPFKAQVTAYTDVIGYGMYMEIKSNKNLDEHLGYIVHNTPDHKGNTPADLTGYFWALQLYKLANENDNSYKYALFDLTFGKSSEFKIYEMPFETNTKHSRSAHALMNANPDTFGLFMDGQTATNGVNYFNNFEDSKNNLFYSGDDDNGVGRDEMINFLKSSFERHSPKLQQGPTFRTNGGNELSWYINPIPDFKKVQSYDYMLDEFEVEEIVDQQAVLPYTIIREWSYWKYANPNNPNDVTEDKNKVSSNTSYIDVDGNINTLYIRSHSHQDVFGNPAFFGDDASGKTVALGKMPVMGATKFNQLPKGVNSFSDYTSTLIKWQSFQKQKSYKIYRALDINQIVFYKGKSYIVTEVDYINEISVIGGTTGII